jgi:type I restriction-modification system DNA methylase subunit
MTTESATIVQRLWNYCNVLRDDGVSYGDYVEQLTYLLFLKMADEQEREFGKVSSIPPEYSWASLRGLEGDDLERHYRAILADLGRGSGLIPVIFRKAQNRIKDPANLRRIIAEVERRLSAVAALEGTVSAALAHARRLRQAVCSSRRSRASWWSRTRRMNRRQCC